MIDPRFWLPHWRARRALAGYPRYTVPHPQSEATLDAAQAMENFDHFMAVRLERLTAFRAWLARHFGVAATLDEPGLRAVEAWAERYGGGLVEDFAATIKAFAYYQPAWGRSLAGCNVMVDLAIFIGEYMIVQRPFLHWFCSFLCPDGFVPQSIPEYGRPHIGGFPRPWQMNVFQMGSGTILAGRTRSELGHNRMTVRKDALVDWCRQNVRFSDAPNDDTPYIF
jgi:hypothetical protein